MKVCFPVYKDDGVNSTVYGHFGSAPEFIVINTEIQSTITVGNKDLDHVHGACNPVMAVGGHKIDAVVVGGIGAGSVSRYLFSSAPLQCAFAGGHNRASVP